MKSKINNINKITFDDYASKQSTIFPDKTIIKEPYPIHWHNQYEIEYITSGTGSQLLNNKKYEVAPGTLTLYTPTDFHEFTPNEDVTVLKIIFEDTAVEPKLLNAIYNLPSNISKKFSGSEKDIFDNLFNSVFVAQKQIKDTQKLTFIYKKFLEIILTYIVNFFESHTLSERADKNEQDDINLILSYIQKNFRQQISLNEIAKHIHYSPSYFSKYFHKRMGVTFKEYIKRKRMDFAAKMIVATDNSITDICYEAGFNSLATFTNEFKKHYALTPIEYRKKNK